MNWREPKLICYTTEELMCKIKVKADSIEHPECDIAYIDEHACPELSVGDTWGDGTGGGGEVGCGIISQCIEVGPLFGCSSGVACSSFAPVFR